MNKIAARQHGRQQRRSLSPTMQQQHRQRLKDVAHTCALLQQAQHIACYHACDGEIDPMPLIQGLWQRGCHCYLPILKDDHLVFAPYHANTPLYRHHRGIEQPDVRSMVTPHFDVMLIPVVAFDHHGHRVGRGQGHYDRYLQSHQPRPGLLGLAHECQKVHDIDPEPHDVSLDYVATEQQLYACKELT